MTRSNDANSELAARIQGHLNERGMDSHIAGRMGLHLEREQWERIVAALSTSAPQSESGPIDMARVLGTATAEGEIPSLSSVSPSEKEQPSGMAWMASLGPTRGEATVRELRQLAAYHIESDHDRELVQHAADMLEIAMRYLQSATPDSDMAKELLRRVVQAHDDMIAGGGLPTRPKVFALQVVMDEARAALSSGSESKEP